MKPFEELDSDVQSLIEQYCKEDPHGLSPKTLYKNIVGTVQTVSVSDTAKIFEVSQSLVQKIKTENE